ncbi:hypothetical protein AL038_18705 [Beggiatoa leptomitoformis]|uniref:Uncharacterized protein n=1 Tax=Beggiatoa leptomitoformis TaxID=288004 RepID=A0A650GD42_9GAMM|nr:hypothetical protein AL038_18705 [Beggiatoa leptomitoformis]QGX04063.1 hypothetical protein BLE401_18545 [Beggiatoa leptomitoformis]
MMAFLVNGNYVDDKRYGMYGYRVFCVLNNHNFVEKGGQRDAEADEFPSVFITEVTRFLIF